MLPYIAQPVLRLGPLQIHAFGVLVAAAVLVGAAVARRRARARGLDETVMADLLTWVVGFGFVGGHVIDLMLYEPRKVAVDPLSLLRVWESLGSFGGFIGAVAGALLFFRRRGSVRQSWKYLDAVAYAFPFGWIFGRLGCALAFDHPGIATEVFIGQRYSDGVVRHNLGLEEALLHNRDRRGVPRPRTYAASHGLLPRCTAARLCAGAVPARRATGRRREIRRLDAGAVRFTTGAGFALTLLGIAA